MICTGMSSGMSGSSKVSPAPPFGRPAAGLDSVGLDAREQSTVEPLQSQPAGQPD